MFTDRNEKTHSTVSPLVFICIYSFSIATPKWAPRRSMLTVKNYFNQTFYYDEPLKTRDAAPCSFLLFSKFTDSFGKK